MDGDSLMGQVFSYVWKCLTPISLFINKTVKTQVVDPSHDQQKDHSIITTIPSDDETQHVSSSNPENVPYVVVGLGNVKEIDSEKLIQVVEEITVVEKEISKKEESGSSNSSRSIKWINGEYSSMHSILLVGEGDFSFSTSLAVAFGSASNIVATSLDSYEFLIENYKSFMNNKMKIESRGGLVMHGVDARRMSKDARLSTAKFDCIIFNFPHTGDFSRTDPELELRKSKELVRGFIRSAKKMINKDGEIHIRHKTNGYFQLWDLPKIGSDQGLFLIQKPKFYRDYYPGYHTKVGFGGNKDFDCKPSRTYKFGYGTTTTTTTTITPPLKKDQQIQKAEEYFVEKIHEKIIQIIQEIVENKLVVKEKKEINKGYGTTTTASSHHYITIPNTQTEHEFKVNVKKIGQYRSEHKILCVGEGDFSFSASLAVAFGSATNIVATSLNSQEFLMENYSNFLINKEKLESRGAVIVHGVNVRSMFKDSFLGTLKFDRIIFNFPHAGNFGTTDSDLRKHKELIRGFLRNAKKMINEDGEIHITHKSNEFYLQWDIPKIGSDHNLRLIEAIKFRRSKYPGYHTKSGFGGDKDFECAPSKTYKFGLLLK